jgi:hypothetical protein
MLFHSASFDRTHSREARPLEFYEEHPELACLAEDMILWQLNHEIAARFVDILPALSAAFPNTRTPRLPLGAPEEHRRRAGTPPRAAGARARNVSLRIHAYLEKLELVLAGETGLSVALLRALFRHASLPGLRAPHIALFLSAEGASLFFTPLSSDCGQMTNLPVLSDVVVNLHMVRFQGIHGPAIREPEHTMR